MMAELTHRLHLLALSLHCSVIFSATLGFGDLVQALGK